MSTADEAVNKAADQIDEGVAELKDQAVRPETLEHLSDVSDGVVIPDENPAPDQKPESESRE